MSEIRERLKDLCGRMRAASQWHGDGAEEDFSSAAIEIGAIIAALDEEAPPNAEIRKLRALLRERDGGAHDADCKVHRGNHCTCGHQDVLDYFAALDAETKEPAPQALPEPLGWLYRRRDFNHHCWDEWRAVEPTDTQTVEERVAEIRAAIQRGSRVELVGVYRDVPAVTPQALPEPVAWRAKVDGEWSFASSETRLTAHAVDAGEGFATDIQPLYAAPPASALPCPAVTLPAGFPWTAGVRAMLAAELRDIIADPESSRHLDEYDMAAAVHIADWLNGIKIEGDNQ